MTVRRVRDKRLRRVGKSRTRESGIVAGQEDIIIEVARELAKRGTRDE